MRAQLHVYLVPVVVICGRGSTCTRNPIELERSVEESPMAESGSARKRSYDMAFKLKVVACAEGESNRGAARRFGVDEKRVREWRKLKAEIADRGPKKERLQGGGKKTVIAADKEEQFS